ncbi:ComEA family DNA-binding protein [Lacinutrix salivirga]
MSKIKSHFMFTKQQRNGIFFLVFLIIVLQCAYFFIEKPSVIVNDNTEEFQRFNKEMDSLKLLALEQKKPKIYPFNPNFITDYKGYTLGMTPEEIDRLHAYRKQDKWVNSSKEFQQITKISDSLLASISPYFKFPEWVTNPKPKTYNYSNNYNNTPKTFQQKIDLNTATAAQLKKVNGIGEKLSERIIKYREKNNGFVSDIELSEVYGLSPEVIERVTNQFTVKTPKSIKKVALNTATRDQLVTIKHIDYEIAHQIIEQRTLRDGFKSLDELEKVKYFPIQKIEIIKLYLSLE